jgi:hypothetical protein
MDENSCVIYSGPRFTLEWYYDKDGNSNVYDYFLGTTQEQKRKFLILVKYLIKQNLGMKETEYMHLNHSRTGFYKKTDKLPKNEKDLALKLMNDYFDRNP